jgi:hypothetical protein
MRIGCIGGYADLGWSKIQTDEKEQWVYVCLDWRMAAWRV